jgi:hypothetical protein
VLESALQEYIRLQPSKAKLTGFYDTWGERVSKTDGREFKEARQQVMNFINNNKKPRTVVRAANCRCLVG